LTDSSFYNIMTSTVHQYQLKCISVYVAQNAKSSNSNLSLFNSATYEDFVYSQEL
ncbi:1981_t:CDS:2, partial [Dentiscutata erythropus]